MFNFNKAIKDVFSGLDNLFTSDKERNDHAEKIAAIKLKVQEMENGISHALIDRAKAIGLVSWIGRWPDMIGCILALGLFTDLVVRPYLHPFGIILPDIKEQELMGFAATLLGLKGIGAVVDVKTSK